MRSLSILPLLLALFVLTIVCELRSRSIEASGVRHAMELRAN